MADIKYIEPTPANIERLQIAFNEADCIVQGADEKIQAATHHIKLMLGEPDSVWLREHIKTLCEQIETNSFDAMNAVNSFAEDAGAHYVNEKSRIEETVTHAAARQLDTQSTLP